MKKNNFLLFSILFLLFNSSLLSAQINWPFENNNVQGTVVGSIGEIRGNATRARFHKGADLTNGTNYGIYAINAGTVTFGNPSGNWSQGSSYILVNGVYYYHCKPKAAILNNSITTVEVGDYLGEMITSGSIHVHLQESNTNYLDNNLSPYNDNHSPEVITTRLTNGYKFYRNSIQRTSTNYTNLELNDTREFNNRDYTTLYSKVDIAADIEDRRINSNGASGGGRTAPYSLKYSLHEDESTTAPLYEYNLSFNAVPNNAAANFVFHPQSLSPGVRSIHIITSYPHGTNNVDHFDRFFNTLIRKDVTEDWGNDNDLNAHYNGDAEFPDNRYNLVIDAYDVDYDATPNNSLDDVIEAPILIDNFKPFVKKISITNEFNNTNYYAAEWKFENEALTLDVTTNMTVPLNQHVTVKVYPSEAMKEIQLTFLQSSYNLQKIENTGSETFWEITIPPSNSNTSGTQRLKFFGKDLADNNLLVNPSLLGHRQADGTWPATLITNNDQNHQIIIGGNVGSSIFGADFNHYINGNNNKNSQSNIKSNTNCLEISFQDTSNPIDNITGWSWNFGDILNSASAEQNPVFSYITAGVYDVTLTVANNLNQTSTVTKTITVSDCNSNLNALISADVTSGTSPLVVDFTDLSIGDIYQRTWNITNGGGGSFNYNYIFGDEHSQNPTISFVSAYSEANVQVNLTVEDENGETAISNTINLTTTTADNSSLNVNFTTDGAIYTGSFIQFEGAATGNCNNYQYQWTFNDWNGPHYSSLPETTYSFPVPGVYAVELCVTDNCGNQVCTTKNITIQNFTSNVVADFSSNISNNELIVQKGEPVIFYDRSEPLNDILYWSWYWDYDVTDAEPDLNYFGNQKPSSITHTYNELGTHRVRLYVAEDLYHAGSYTEKLITVVDEYDYLDIPIIHQESESNLAIQNSYGQIMKLIDLNGYTLVRENGKIKIFNESNNLEHTIEPSLNEEFTQVFDGFNNTIVLGVDTSNANGNNITQLYVYKKSGNTWVNPILSQKIDVEETYTGDPGGISNFVLNDKILAVTETSRTPIDENNSARYSEDLYIILYERNSVDDEFYQKAILKNSDPKLTDHTSPNYQYDRFDYFGDRIVMDNDVLITPVSDTFVSGILGRKNLLVFEKPDEGWRDMTETARLSLGNCSSNSARCGTGSGANIKGNIITAAIEDTRASDAGKSGNHGKIALFERPADGWRNMTETAILGAYIGNIEDEVTGIGSAILSDTYIVGAIGKVRDSRTTSAISVFYKSANGWTDKSIEDFRIYPLIPEDNFEYKPFDYGLFNNQLKLFVRKIDPSSNIIINNLVYTFNLNESYSPEQTACYEDVFINNIQYNSYTQSGAEGKNVTISNVTVNQNIGVLFKGTERILIKPNTTIKSGANFVAKIVDCNSINQ